MFTHYTDDDPHTDMRIGNLVLRHVHNLKVPFPYYLFTATGEVVALLSDIEVELALRTNALVAAKLS